MDILINSLYTQKEIFLREVISNASDALDKIRFLSLTDPSVLGDTKNLEIRVKIDQDSNSISITDTGLGMTRSELIENLGTIAKSGTTNFLDALAGGNINLIGQFGVGFYSTFLAGSKIVVRSKSNNDEQYVWTSEAAASFTIEKDEGSPLGRGTEVKIYLKEDAKEFANERKLENLIKKYSEFIDFPIYLLKKHEVEVDAPQEEENSADSDDDIEVAEKKEDKPSKIKKTELKWEQINVNKAIWLRDEEDLYEEDYVDFFKSISKQSNPPMNWIHFDTEGEVVFTSVLYIPNRAPSDFYSQYNTRKNDLKLYVRRVLIAEKHADLIPKYLSFVQGVIDSDDLPLNVNRETLQQTKAFKIINQKITKKILDMISEIAKWEFVDEDEFDEEDSEEDVEALSEEELEKKREDAKAASLKKNKERFDNFYNEFGKAIKLGIIDDKNNRKKLASLARWHSTRNLTELISFDDYIGRMKTVQDQIYYASGEDKNVLAKSPLVVGLVRKGYEVILCDDPIDEYVFGVLREYEEKNIVNVGKGDFKMPDDDEFERKKQKFLSKKFEPFIEYAKKLLFEEVGNVIVSNRLTNEPCVVVADSYGHSSFMDKIQKASMFAGANDNPLQNFKKILEINPHHKVIQIILERINVRVSLFRTRRPTRNWRSLWSCSTRLRHSTQGSAPRTLTLSSRDSTRFTRRQWEWSAWNASKWKWKMWSWRQRTTRATTRTPSTSTPQTSNSKPSNSDLFTYYSFSYLS